MEDESYEKGLARGQAQFEEMCSRCGDCCGGDTDDPCHNLQKDQDGLYFCRDYKDRLGLQKTVNGRLFECVEIRVHIAKGKLSHRCGYNKLKDRK